MFRNTIGRQNTAIGWDALYSNTTGLNNTGTGLDALYWNTTGESNMANGFDALGTNTTGGDNTASGFEALIQNTTGNFNIALGSQAGWNLNTGSNNIDIGNVGVAAESNIIRIGNEVAVTVGGVVHPAHTKAFIAGISGVAVTGTPVVVSSDGQLGVAPSSERFKEGVKPIEEASEAILELHPVTFRYKKELDPDGIPQFGLVAEQVEKVNPDLVVRGEDGKVMTVRYEAVNAMLLNEFLKEHRKVEEQDRKAQEQAAAITQLTATVAKQEASIVQQQKDFQATAAQQQKEIKSLTANLKEQAAQIQKVSAQVEMSKPTPQVAANTH